MVGHQRPGANDQHPLGLLLLGPPLGLPLGAALLLGLGGLLDLLAPAPLRRLAGLATLDAVHVLHHLFGPPARLELVLHAGRRQRIDLRALAARPARAVGVGHPPIGAHALVDRPGLPDHHRQAQARQQSAAPTRHAHSSSHRVAPEKLDPLQSLGRACAKCERLPPGTRAHHGSEVLYLSSIRV